MSQTTSRPASDGRFTRLPEPVRLDDTVTSEDVVVVHEVDQDQNEVRWLLRTAIA